MIDLAFIAFIGFVLLLGLRRPYLWVLLYIYIDILAPQQIGYGIITNLSVSFIAFCAAFVGWAVLDRKEGSRFTLRQGLMLALLVYCWWTTGNADFPVEAELKWEWVWKALFFAIFLPLTITTRLRLEALALVMIVVVIALGTAARFYFVSWIGERVVADIRRKVHRNLLRLSPAFYEENSPKEISSRMTADTAIIETVVGTTVSVALRNVFLGIGGTIYLFWLLPGFTVWLAIGIPVTILPIVFFGRRIRTISRDSQDRVADVGAMVTEVLGAMKVVQSFNQQGREAGRFGDAVERTFDTARKRIILRAVMTSVIIFAIFGSIVFMAAPPKKAFALRLDPAVHAAIERLAGAELRSSNAQIEMLLREALKARGIEVEASAKPKRGRPPKSGG